MRRMALVAYFVSVVISSACASSDEFGWWRVKDVPVPDVEFQDDSPPLRALPVPDGTVNMDLGLALVLPATTFEHIAELARGLDYNPDNWVGGRYLDYRFGDAKQIVSDIYNGEGVAHVSD